MAYFLIFFTSESLSCCYKIVGMDVSSRGSWRGWTLSVELILFKHSCKLMWFLKFTCSSFGTAGRIWDKCTRLGSEFKSTE